jgi:biopolymer transport protein ExbD
MAMSVGSGGGDEPGVMANINTTPLVDVMLVLLIIFLITIPVINKTVKVDLPKAVNIPQPEVHIRADRDARYEAVGRVLYALQRGGIVKVGFLTEPDHGVRGTR